MKMRTTIVCLLLSMCHLTSASTETSWNRIKECRYEKNKHEKFLEDFNHVSQKLAEKHENNGPYSGTDKTLTPLFSPHPGQISLQTYGKVIRCNAELRIYVLKANASHVRSNLDANNWMQCYKNLYPKDHPVIVAANMLNACIHK